VLFAPRGDDVFPQLEVNVDAYPMLPGIHIHFVTNAKGKGAQDKARVLVSEFQVPFDFMRR
jgi:large subunit ribosomal protein L5